MCNFVVQEFNRGGVIYGLPDNSGKARPMVLLNDIKPNGVGVYGHTMNALQIQSGAYNKYEIPIKMWNGATQNYRSSFISVLHTLQFTPAELLTGDTRFVGIVPKDILDLACNIYTSYITLDYKKLDQYAEEVKQLRIEFMRRWGEKYLDYRDETGGVIRLHSSGKEERTADGKFSFANSQNNGQTLIGKNIQRILSEQSEITTGFGTIQETSDKSPVVTEPESPVDKEKENPPIEEKSGHKKELVVDKFGWILSKKVTSQSDNALKQFLHALDNTSPKKLVKQCGYTHPKSLYARRKSCLEEITRRVDAHQMALTDEELEILLRLGEGKRGANIKPTKRKKAKKATS